MRTAYLEVYVKHNRFVIANSNLLSVGKSAGSTTVAPKPLIVCIACSNTTLTKGSLPVIVSFVKTFRGTPIRAPRSAFVFLTAREKLGTGSGCARVKLSFGSGPAITERTAAASVSERQIGPTVSWCSDMGITG